MREAADVGVAGADTVIGEYTSTTVSSMLTKAMSLPLLAGWERTMASKRPTGPGACGDSCELFDVAAGVFVQMRVQNGWRIDLVKQGRQCSMAQQNHAINAVGTSYQRADFCARIRVFISSSI